MSLLQFWSCILVSFIAKMNCDSFEIGMAHHDGTLGILPYVFEEEDDANIDLFQKDDINEFLKICEHGGCEECGLVFRNGWNLSTKSKRCDSLSTYNFKKLRHAQYVVESKRNEQRNALFNYTYFILYSINLLLGLSLLAMQHMRIQTLFNPFAYDPTQGPRTSIYMQKGFKFDLADVGMEPETVDGMVKSRHDAEAGFPNLHRQMQGKSVTMWPWELRGYDFSAITYWAKQTADEDSDSNEFNSNI